MLENDPRATEIADWIYANPGKGHSEASAHFDRIWPDGEGRSDRFRKLWDIAQDYHRVRMAKAERVRQYHINEEAVAQLRAGTLTRAEVLFELSEDFKALKKIVAGSVFRDVDPETGKVVGYRQAGFSDEVQAKRARVGIAQQMSDIEGWALGDELPPDHTLTIKFIDDNGVLRRRGIQVGDQPVDPPSL